MKNKPKKSVHSRRNIEDDYSSNIVARSELMLAIATVIQEKGWTQAQAADFLGVGQPRVSDLIQGRVDRFTVDMLMIWLQKLGKDVSVLIRENVFASEEKVMLVLYVCGNAEQRVLGNVTKLFGGDTDSFTLRVVDVLKNTEEAASQRISSTPCLVKESPLPRVTLTGDLSVASVRWQLAVAERESFENRAAHQGLRQAEQDMREANLNERERSIGKKRKTQDDAS